MNKKTRQYVQSIEEACRAAQAIPGSYRPGTPGGEFIATLWKQRDKWLDKLTASLPEYEIPATASALAKACYWPDCEGAWRLPDGRLLVCMIDFTMPYVMTEAEWLSELAHRTIGLFEDIRRNGDGYERMDIRRSILSAMKSPA